MSFGTLSVLLGAEPVVKLEVQYDDYYINFGTEVKPANVMKPPTSIGWPVDSSSALYTLYMFDPDSKPVETNHWLVTNIPGCQLAQGNLVAPYSGSKPPEGTGMHRYVFIAYKQEDRIPSLRPVITADERHAFTLQEFVEKHKLGNPYAANFMTGKPDEYSINFWKNLKKK